MYELIIFLYTIGVSIASIFKEKPRKMLRGEKDSFKTLKQKVDPKERYVWFHASSLGEFEQGRPIMERLKKKMPQYKILLTFFSPSGYEVRKDYPVADIICYLPLDLHLWSKKFLDLIHPEIVFFIKYEFWWNYLSILKKRNIPVYSVSSIFRENQIFFKWYGKQYGRVLNCFSRFFVQNEVSRTLLGKIGIDNVDITGDTRFDRVLEIRSLSKRLPLIEAFKQNSKVLVAGSSWLPDEEIFIRYFNDRKDWKLIIAPHLINENRLKQIESLLKCESIRYTKATKENVQNVRCIIMDCFGLLSSVYGYADVTYVGGGFGVGIHNLLEAAVWGVSVIFGPNNSRFQEAHDLMDCGGGHQINSFEDFSQLMDTYIKDENLLKEDGKKAELYVKENSGATIRILKAIFPEAF